MDSGAIHGELRQVAEPRFADAEKIKSFRGRIVGRTLDFRQGGESVAEVESGRGLPQSKSFANFLRYKHRASVLDCASPLALSDGYNFF
jgi:hypothetical protein